MLLSDAPQRGGPASIIKVQTKIANTNWGAEVIDLEGQAELSLKDGQNLVSTYSYKNIPKGEKKDASYKVNNIFHGKHFKIYTINMLKVKITPFVSIRQRKSNSIDYDGFS